MSDQRKSLDEFLAENPMAQSQIDAQKTVIAEAAYNQGLELAASIAENGKFLHEESPVARFGQECAAAIRREKTKPDQTNYPAKRTIVLSIELEVTTWEDISGLSGDELAARVWDAVVNERNELASSARIAAIDIMTGENP